MAAMAPIIWLWEASDGTLLGAAHREGPGEVFLELRPEARQLEPSMLAWAEAHLAVTGSSRQPEVELAAYEDDQPRQRVLAARGYEIRATGGRIRTMRIGPSAAATLPLPFGYDLATAGGSASDCARMAALLNDAFGRVAHTAREYRTFVEQSPSFDEGLNLVAVAGDGTFACHVGISLDPMNRHAIVEPVATAAAHRRHGLARTLLIEGLRRAADRGSTVASVETGDEVAANAFYETCGFGDAHAFHIWRKVVG